MAATTTEPSTMEATSAETTSMETATSRSHHQPPPAVASCPSCVSKDNRCDAD